MTPITDKILIIGHARHGKDTVAEYLREVYSLEYEGSSTAAARIFLFAALKDKYNYKTADECFKDRVNHRHEWRDLICKYNEKDKSRLAKDILTNADIYVGMRSNDEINECKKQGFFKLIIGVYNPNVPLELPNSFNIDIWKHADLVIPNAGTLAELKTRILNISINYPFYYVK